MKPIHIIGIVVLSVAVAVIISLYNNSSEYLTIQEAEVMGQEHPGKTYHVVTELRSDLPMIYDPQTDANYFEFYVSDSTTAMKKVVFRKPKPHDLERTDKIVLEGYDKGTHFEAENILLKCPSKYQEETAEGQTSY